MMKKLLATSLALAITGISAPAMAMESDVSIDASVSASNMYLWRGTDLGDGDAQIAADLTASSGGFYAGTWVSSGDASSTEIDLYAGYGFETESGFSADLSYWSYLYPKKGTGFAEIAEIAGTLGYGPISYSVYYDVSKKNSPDDWNYMTLSAEYGKFGILLGKHNDHSADGLFHTDLSYSYNDNLSFTLSIPVDDDKNNPADPMIAATLSLPIEF